MSTPKSAISPAFRASTDVIRLAPIAAEETRYRVLIVDDSSSFQKLLSLTLSMQPHIGVIDCVSSGEEAIKQSKAKQYDMVFIDALMPGMDGYQTCSLLRKYEKYKETPVIMVTGLTSPTDEGKAIIAGSSHFVTKPIQQRAFKEMLDRVIFMIEYKKKHFKA